jgi:monoamine oxidase
VERPDAIVIGAGVAGLCAAHELGTEGHRVLVLEAQDRAGGRIRTLRVPATPPLELGAEFVHGRPPELWTLLDDAGLAAGDADGEHLLVRDGELISAGDDMRRVDEVFSNIYPPDEPIGERIARSFRKDDPARAFAMAYAEGFNAADARTASGVAIGRMTRAATAQTGHDIHRVMRGYDKLVDFLLARLKGLPVELVLGARVESIAWRKGAVAVAAGAPLRARAAVITVPLPMLEQLHFDPPLEEKQARWRALEMGNVVKAFLRFSDAVPWRTRHFAFIHAPQLAFPTFWRLTPFPTQTLVGWAAGPKGSALADASDTQVLEAALASVATLFGVERRALDRWLLGAHVSNWARDPFTRGAYCVVPSGAAEAQDELSDPVDETLFFAGEATEPSFAGTVHGAIISGERAGQEAAQVFRSDWDPRLLPIDQAVP